MFLQQQERLEAEGKIFAEVKNICINFLPDTGSKKKKKKKKKGEKVLASNGYSELSIVLYFFYVYVTLKASSPSQTSPLISP